MTTKYYREKLDYSVRYPPNWDEVAKDTKNLSQNRCILCLNPADHVHHAVYKRLDGKPIAGRERKMRDIFPLCKECHEIAHSSLNWVRDYEDPVFGNRNTIEFWRKLRISWLKNFVRNRSKRHSEAKRRDNSLVNPCSKHIAHC